MGTLKMMQMFLLFLSLLACFPQLIHGEVVHLIVFAVTYTNVERTSSTSRPHYQCYRSNVDEDALLSYGRSAPITTDRSPPPDQQHSQGFPQYRVVKFPVGDGWDRDGFGPFYAEAYKPGRDVTRVTTFFQRNDAKFISSDGLFTKTVNVNDTGVMISMTVRYDPDAEGNIVTWRKDGGDVLTLFNGQTQITFANPIQPSDEGIYEIYYDTERNQSRGGLYRLIVRECTAGRWGPPECYGICDKCYNGGVCDDKSGLCICPNNFRGPNCLDICNPDGGNRFGLNCEFRCSYSQQDPPTPCHNLLFCLPDPYGCSCDVGAGGHTCRTSCTTGTYGPGCSQPCHCAEGYCDRYSGRCTTCEAGWSGDNCQIPDVCEVGYYGPQCADKCHCLNDEQCDKQTGGCPQLYQCAAGYKLRIGQVNCRECEGGTFGVDCLQQCHCAAEACETERGLCNGQCLHNWIEPDCQIGITRLVPVRVNSYQATNFTCYVEGNPPPDETLVDLFRYTERTYNNTGIFRISSSVSDSERAVVFYVDSVYPEDYICTCTISDGNAGLYSIHSSSFVLPVIQEEPVILNTASTAVHLQWNAWSEGDDIGDPPLVGYDVFVKGDGDWLVAQRVLQPVISATVNDLYPDTDYMFSVAAVREGPGGTGPRSPDVRTTTLCGKPSASPTGVQESASNPRELELTWEPISPESAKCRSGVTHYVIYYIPAGSTSPNFVSVYGATSYTLTQLDTFLDYTIQITASNKDEESDRSSEIVTKTLEEVAPAPINVAIPRSTTSSFTVSWSTPLPSNINGKIKKFIIRYQQTAPVVNGDYDMEEVLTGAFEGEHTVVDLTAETNYTVQVQTVNGVGASEWSEPVNVKTILSGAEGDNKIQVGAVVGGTIVPVIIFLLLIVPAIFHRRLKQRCVKAKPQAVASNTASEISPKFENPVFGESIDEPH